MLHPDLNVTKTQTEELPPPKTIRINPFGEPLESLSDPLAQQAEAATNSRRYLELISTGPRELEHIYNGEIVAGEGIDPGADNADNSPTDQPK